MKRYLAFLAAFLGLGILLTQTVLAADPFRVEINAVSERPGEILAIVSAFDINNNPMAQLTEDNFKARLDNEDVTIDSVEADSSRLSTGIVLLVDVSGSMAGEPIDQAKQALQGFINNLGENDEVAIITFDTDVKLVQDFTSDRVQLSGAISNLTPGDSTALYDAVITGTAKALESTADQRLVVLLSDGVETVNSHNEDAALEAASSNGVGIAAVGLGADIDKDFLTQITSLSNGRLLEAATPAALATAYAELADAIRSQYTLRIIVPETMNRTIRSQLEIKLTVRNESVTAQKIIDPLFGATAPDFQIDLTGIKPGQKVDSVLTLTPSGPGSRELVSVEYLIDNKVVHSSGAGSLDYQLDTTGLGVGSHILKVTAIDTEGATGETIVTFSVPAPPQPSQVGKLAGLLLKVLIALFVLLLLGLVGVLLFKILSKRRGGNPGGYTDDRIRPWAGRELPEDMSPPEDWPERPKVEVAAPRRVLGRIVVMNETAIQSGDLSAIRDFRIGNAPLTLGTSPHCDIQVEDAEGRIAAEEARIWIQKGRLVYHKLTTLSAMATEGVTSGWLLLADGEELHLGAYRILYQSDIPEEEPAEHGEPQPVDEETAHSLQQFEDEALEHKEALEKAGLAEDTSPPRPLSVAGMWIDPDTVSPDNGIAPSDRISPPVEAPQAIVEPAVAEVVDMPTPVKAEVTALPEDEAEEGKTTAESDSASEAAANFTDAWTSPPEPEEGSAPHVDEEEMLKALRALEEASLREPQRSPDQSASDAQDNSEEDSGWGDQRSQESA